MTKLMKTLMLVGTLMVASTPVTAQEDNCEMAGDIAEVIMENRQEGTSLSDMIAIAGDNQYVKALVLIAYEVPRFSSDSYKEQAAQDFRNEVELACYSNQ